MPDGAYRVGSLFWASIESLTGVKNRELLPAISCFLHYSDRALPEHFELAAPHDHTRCLINSHTNKARVRVNGRAQAWLATAFHKMLINDDLRPKSKAVADRRNRAGLLRFRVPCDHDFRDYCCAGARSPNDRALVVPLTNRFYYAETLKRLHQVRLVAAGHPNHTGRAH